ncbi:MAG: hypothetical protein ACI4SV_03970 [Duodenibacillus sp.]
MTKREKRLACLLLLVALAAAADWGWNNFATFSSVKETGEPDKVLAEARSAQSRASQVLLHPEISLTAMRIMERTETPLLEDPLTIDPALVARQGAMAVPGLAYTGYIAVGSERFAVIGGREYAVGDEIEATDERVTAIDENAVRLEHRKNLTERTLQYSGSDAHAGMGQ